MNNIKMEVKQDIAIAHHALNALNSEVTIQAIQSTILQEFKKMNATRKDNAPVEVSLNWRHNGLTVSVSAIADYEVLVNHPKTSIENIKTIDCRYLITQIQCSHSNVPCDINFNFYCDLPDDDLQVLRMLGKVKYQRPSPSYYDDREYVACDAYYNGLPF